MIATALEFREIRRAFEEQPLFEDKSWQLSPAAWELTAKQVREIERIGEACLAFHKALERLYLRAYEGQNLLRNRKLTAPWVAEFLDRGKPGPLLEHARSKRTRGVLPSVIRPDLLVTEEGFALTEIDSVPGGIGLTAFLNRLYSGDPTVIGGADAMIEGFYRSLADMAPDKELPVIAILVSDEAATYRPEMEWMAGVLREQGRKVYCLHPSEVIPLGNTVCLDAEGSPEQIDVIYRFWELFDLANVPIAQYILDAWEDSQLKVTPPMRPFQEEKMALALFHHHILEEYWKESLPRADFELLSQIIPKSWIVEPADLPPNAVLDAPSVGGKPIRSWEELGEASQKERDYILKISGFHEEAWGARSVLYGGDTSRGRWREGLQEACARSDRNPYILQEYRKPKRLRHSLYWPREEEEEPAVKEVEGRLRLCPYYFVSNNTVRLSGILATFCPADKKIIHGMRDAAMLPCRQGEAESANRLSE